MDCSVGTTDSQSSRGKRYILVTKHVLLAQFANIPPGLQEPVRQFRLATLCCQSVEVDELLISESMKMTL